MSEQMTEIPPVRVHVASVDEGVAISGPQRARGRIVTAFGTETVDDSNPVRPLLPESPERVCAYVQATGGDVYLCDSEAKANQAHDTASSDLGTLLPHGNTAPWPVGGQQAVWIAQVTAASSCIVSFTADYE